MLQFIGIALCIFDNYSAVITSSEISHNDNSRLWVALGARTDSRRDMLRCGGIWGEMS